MTTNSEEVYDAIVKENNYITNYFVNCTFKNPKNPVKIRSNWYKEEVVSILAYGQTTVIDFLIKAHHQNPYNNIDEFIGDLQTMGVKILNNFNVKGGFGKGDEFNLEKFFDGTSHKNKKEIDNEV